MAATYALGWHPDLPDGRDAAYAADVELTDDLPADVDLRPGCPAVWDQGWLQSCTAHAIAAALEFEQIKRGDRDPYTPSRLYIYFYERWLEHSERSNTGAMIRHGFKVVNRFGVPPEQLWPYEADAFDDEPSQDAADAAAATRRRGPIEYRRIPPQLNQLKACLASGHPFVFGFTVFDSFMSDAVRRTGVAGLPRAKERTHGGHAVLAVGYSEDDQRFLVRNSWGEDWGIGGHFTMPFPYLLQASLARDFWTVRRR